MDKMFALKPRINHEEKDNFGKRIVNLQNIMKQVESIEDFFSKTVNDCKALLTRDDASLEGCSWNQVPPPLPAPKRVHDELMFKVIKEMKRTDDWQVQPTRAINEEAAYKVGKISHGIHAHLKNLQKYWNEVEGNDIDILIARIKSTVPDDCEHSLKKRAQAQEQFEEAVDTVEDTEIEFLKNIKKCLSEGWYGLRYDNTDAQRSSALPTGSEDASQSFEEWVKWSTALTTSEFVNRSAKHMDKLSKWTAYFLYHGVDGLDHRSVDPSTRHVYRWKYPEDESESNDTSGGSSQAEEDSDDEDVDDDEDGEGAQDSATENGQGDEGSRGRKRKREDQNGADGAAQKKKPHE
ncbi:MAG: hypothetical protein M1831_000094 [Alyxoria varia]|nr:MAG: hypothetical protein M1831_000094 [Alyxoria varia]